MHVHVDGQRRLVGVEAATFVERMNDAQQLGDVLLSGGDGEGVLGAIIEAHDEMVVVAGASGEPL